MIGVVLGFLWRRHRVSVVLSLLVPVALGGLAGLIYPGLREQTDALNALMEGLPFVQNFLDSRYVEPFSEVSIFTLPYRHPLTLLLYAAIPAVPILALPAAVRGQGSLHLLLASPLERRTLVTGVATFALLLVPAVMLSPFLGTVLGASVAGELDALPVARYWLAGLNAAGLFWFWTGVALVASVLGRDRAAATLWTAVLIVVTFALDSAARLAPSVGWMAWYSPYGYFRPADVVGGSDAWVTRSLGLFAAGFLLAFAAREIEHRRRSA